MIPTKDGATEVYFITNWSRTFRRLEVNEGLFGDTLGQRAFEDPLNSW